MGTRLLAVACAVALGLAAPSLARAADIDFAASASFADTVTQPDGALFVRYCDTSAACASFGFTSIAPQVRFGRPAGATPPSGLGFLAAPPQTVQTGSPFPIGQLTHFNFPIFPGTLASQTTLQLAATVTGSETHAVTVPVVLSIDETPNEPPCVYPSTNPCSDAITWLLPEPIVVLDGATAYVLNVDGFRVTSDASSPALPRFVSQEGGAQQGFLFARLDEHVASASDDAYATPEGTALSVSAPGLLANDGDAADASLAGPPAHGTVTVAADGGFVYTPAAGFVGTDSFTYVAKTPLGAWAIAEATIAVTDEEPPALTSPGDLTAEATGPDGAAVSFSVPVGDNVDSGLVASCSPASGSTFPLGTTGVSCTATDAAGNTGSASFTVTVEDTTAPALSLPAGASAEATGPDGAAVTFVASASDLVDGAVAPACDASSGATFPLGTTTVSCTATDAHGNTASGSFAVTVDDTTAPTLELPGAISVVTAASSGAAVDYTASANDTVDGAVAAVCVPASGSVFPVGTTTVGCTATDAHGNAATGTFAVTVVSVGDLLDELVDLSTGLGPGKSLPMKAANIRADWARGDTGSACSLLGAFVAEVDAQDGKKLTASQAADLRAKAAQVASALGC